MKKVSVSEDYESSGLGIVPGAHITILVWNSAVSVHPVAAPTLFWFSVWLCLTSGCDPTISCAEEFFQMHAWHHGTSASECCVFCNPHWLNLTLHQDQMLSASLKLSLGPSLALGDRSLTALSSPSLSVPFAASCPLPGLFLFFKSALSYCPCLERRRSPFVPKSQARVAAGSARTAPTGLRSIVTAFRQSFEPQRTQHPSHPCCYGPHSSRRSALPAPRAPPAPVSSGAAAAPAPPRRPPNGARRSPADAVTPWRAAAHWPGRRQSSHGQRSAQRRGWAGRLRARPRGAR